jgi:hypothetical protein
LNASSYNRVVLRIWTVLLILSAVLSGCRSSDRSKEKVEAAIQQRLQSQTGLDLKTLDVTTTSVTFEKNLAYATVAFHPKNDPRVDSSMMMKYTLEDKDGRWVVIKVGDSEGHAMGHGSGTALPPGHPAVGGPQQ